MHDRRGLRTGSHPHSRQWLLLIVCAVGLLAAACSSASAESAPEDDVESATDGGVEVDKDAVETEVLSSDPLSRVPGAPVNRFDLQVGQCFNEGSWFDEELDRRVDLTATVDCSTPHQSEVYFEVEFPAESGAQFPGEAPLTEWSTEVCYNQFESFVDAAYEVSTYEIGFVQPTLDTFEHPVGQHRRVFCYVYDDSGATIEGSAEGSGL